MLQLKILNDDEWMIVAQSCLTLCDSMWGYNYTTVGSSVHGILQARALEWVAISFSRESSQPRDWTRVSSIAGTLFTIWSTREASKILNTQVKIPCATTKARCSQINKYSKKKKSFFQFLNSLLISYIYVHMCFYRNMVEFGKTSTNFLSYVGCNVSGHFKLCCAVNNLKYSSNWPYLY